MKIQTKKITFSILTYVIGLVFVSLFLSFFQPKDTLELPKWGVIFFYLYVFGGGFLIYLFFFKTKVIDKKTE